MKQASINTKAQTLVELAVFGSLLLVVLAYFVGMGIRLNYQQDLNMRAQRMAFAKAYYPVDGWGNPSQTTHASATVILTEDHHIPDPRTMFGRGDTGTISASGDAVWGSYIGNPDVIAMDAGVPNPPPFEMYRDVPRIFYNVNGVTSVGGNNLDYSTGGLTQKTTGTFWVALPDGTSVERGLGDLRIVRTGDPADPNTPLPQARMFWSGTNVLLVEAVSWTQNGNKMPIITVYPTNAADGDAVTRIDVLDPRLGGLNPERMNTENIKNEVAEGNLPDIATPLQGLLPVSPVRNTSNNRLTLTETAGGSWQSDTTVDSTVDMDHTIRTNAFGDVIVPYNRTVNRTWTWTTAK